MTDAFSAFTITMTTTNKLEVNSLVMNAAKLVNEIIV